MSSGSTIVPVRFPAEILAAMDREILKSQDTRRGEPWGRSEFIREAVARMIAGRVRSRRWKRRKGIEQT
jgi:Arc/MetJ-type ribon-helix-helix transcriptional regulator